MSKRTEIHIGDKYGRLSIIKEIEPKIWGNQSHRQVLCKCECGNVIKIELTKLVTGYTNPIRCRKCGGSGFLLGNADEIIKRLDVAINTHTPLTMRELKQLKLVLMK